MKMFSLTLIAVLGAFLLGKTECAITGWTSGGGTTATQDVTDTSCASVAEDGTVSFTVTASTDGSVTGYAIQTQPAGGTYMFAVTNGGAVTLASGQLDHEAAGSMIVVIRATDDGSATGDLTCTLTVTDVNEAVPDFSLNTNCLAYDNNLAAGTTIGTVDVTAVATQPVTLSLASGDTGSAFTYTVGTGVLTVGGAALTSTTYSLVFNAVDNASPAQTGSTTLEIRINSACPCSSAVVMAVSAYIFMATLLAFLG